MRHFLAEFMFKDAFGLRKSKSGSNINFLLKADVAATKDDG